MKKRAIVLALALQSVNAGAEILVLDCAPNWTPQHIFYSIQFGDPKTDNVNMKAGIKATVTDEAVALTFAEMPRTQIVISRQSGDMFGIHDGKEVAPMGKCIKVPPKI